jgi:hypothetical protein
MVWMVSDGEMSALSWFMASCPHLPRSAPILTRHRLRCTMQPLSVWRHGGMESHQAPPTATNPHHQGTTRRQADRHAAAGSGQRHLPAGAARGARLAGQGNRGSYRCWAMKDNATTAPYLVIGSILSHPEKVTRYGEMTKYDDKGVPIHGQPHHRCPSAPSLPIVQGWTDMRR